MTSNAIFHTKTTHFGGKTVFFARKTLFSSIKSMKRHFHSENGLDFG